MQRCPGIYQPLSGVRIDTFANKIWDGCHFSREGHTRSHNFQKSNPVLSVPFSPVPRF